MLIIENYPDTPGHPLFLTNSSQLGKEGAGMGVMVKHESAVIMGSLVPGSPAVVVQPERAKLCLFRTDDEGMVTGEVGRVLLDETQARCLKSWLEAHYPGE